MDIVGKINGLNGAVVTRQQLQAHIRNAKTQEQNHIAEKLQSILNAYPDKKSFEMEIVQPQIEVLPNSYLSCLDCEQIDEESNGLAKAVSPSEIYDMITEKILSALDQDLDFEQEWTAGNENGGYMVAYNFASKKPYRGINTIMLGSLYMYDQSQPLLENPYYLTFKQVEELGGKVTKGSKGEICVYFTKLYKIEIASRNIDFGTYDLAKMKAYLAEKGIDQRAMTYIPILKYYKVFNGKDIENIDFDLENFDGKGYIAPIKKGEPVEPIPIAEAIIKHYPKPPKIKFGGDRAFYRPSADLVQMPKMELFKYVQAYYTTFFHELVHSTGADKRLNREKGKKFGDKKYAFEELIAELGASFLSAEAGMLHYTFRNSTAYIKSWRKALVSELKADNRFFFRAASKAQEAVDFMLDRDESNVATYEKHFKPELKPIISNGKKLTKKKAKKTSKIEAKPVTAKVSNGQKKTKKVAEVTETAVIPEAVKFSESKSNKNPRQLALFGAKKEKLNAPFADEIEVLDVEIIQPIQNLKPIHASSKIQKIGTSNNQQSEFFEVDGEVGKFLQQVEKKSVGSVVVTIDGEQGAGKTTMLYQYMQSFAVKGNKSLFLSLEEEPTSHLATSKAEKYITPQAKEFLDTVGEVENVAELYSFIEPYDIIFIDSWQKLQRMVGNIRLDEDLRKKFDGKAFIVIFQQTTTGRTKGGAEVVFDGDIIIKMKKEGSFEFNYAFFDKNRYTLVPIETIRYNIANQKCFNPEERETENTSTENVKLSFEYQEK